VDSKNSSGNQHQRMDSQPAVVGCALLALLANGENLSNPRIAAFVEEGIDSLLESQNRSTGYIGSSMCNHGFVTLALAECYGHIRDERIGPALQKAITLILSSQEKNPKNAWRYTPDSIDADSTVSGCQIVALLAARNAGIAIPDEAIEKGLAYLETCRTSEGSYGYTDSNNGKPTLTAIAVLCHELAQKKETPESKKSLEYLMKRMNYRDPHYPFYYEYYMSQALFQADPEAWEQWNKRNIRYLKLLQGQDGSWNGNHGKAYSTSAALLSLALNYRYMPIYERF